ncbi:MAG TPA: hypothetical protein VF121_07155 [Thermoanaerobaculia bacterium]|nr:hypothetical protein [Thermoanaerobaculia bacterium]
MGSETPPGSRYGRIWRGLTQRLAGVLETARDQTAAAPQLLDELLRHPHAERLRVIQSRHEFRTAPLCAALLEKSYELLARDAEEAERLALLAITLLPELKAPGIGPMLLAELAARAWCLVADARRRRGIHDDAEEAFAEAAE